MIEGEISVSGSPIIETRAIGSRTKVSLKGILDTGFTGHFCSPITTAVSLGLELTDVERVELADGSLKKGG